jgi:hypothetical protein
LTIIITISDSTDYNKFNAAGVFCGTIEHFKDAFFSNADDIAIIEFCIDKGWDVHFYNVLEATVNSFCTTYGTGDEPFYCEVFEFPPSDRGLERL